MPANMTNIFVSRNTRLSGMCYFAFMFVMACDYLHAYTKTLNHKLLNTGKKIKCCL